MTNNQYFKCRYALVFLLFFKLFYPLFCHMDKIAQLIKEIQEPTENDSFIKYISELNKVVFDDKSLWPLDEFGSSIVDAGIIELLLSKVLLLLLLLLVC